MGSILHYVTDVMLLLLLLLLLLFLLLLLLLSLLGDEIARVNGDDVTMRSIEESLSKLTNEVNECSLIRITILTHFN